MTVAPAAAAAGSSANALASRGWHVAGQRGEAFGEASLGTLQSADVSISVGRLGDLEGVRGLGRRSNATIMSRAARRADSLRSSTSGGQDRLRRIACVTPTMRAHPPHDYAVYRSLHVCISAEAERRLAVRRRSACCGDECHARANSRSGPKHAQARSPMPARPFHLADRLMQSGR